MKRYVYTAILGLAVAGLIHAQDETAQPVSDAVESDTQNIQPADTDTNRDKQRIKDDFDRFESKNFKKAVKYFFQKKYEMAQFLLQQELDDNPENYFAYSYLGDIFLYKKRYDEAITLYKRALDLDADNAHNHFRLGQAYYYKELGNLAVEHFTKAYELNPNIKYAQYHIGLTYLIVLRNKQEAIAHWENYLALAPEDPQYEEIRRAVEILRNPEFRIPSVGSDIPLEEALHLGGEVLRETERSDEADISAEHEEKKTIDSTADIDRDDEL
ncbi:MAG: tetratricopeptide repeat protein [Spirochaetota bacterium]